MVANVPVAEVRDVGTHVLLLEKVLVRKTVSYVGNRLADLQEMQKAKVRRGLRRSAVLIRGTQEINETETITGDCYE